MNKKNIFIISALLAITLACTIGSSPPTPQEPVDEIATSVAMTVQAGGIAPSPAPGEPPQATAPLPAMTVAPPTITLTPTITFTPTITLTPTPSIPMVSVSQNTNCRSGPGIVYDYLGALLIGEKAELVGKNTINDYWIIKNQDQFGNCWLWGRYATTEGDISAIPEWTPPPTPTPAPPAAPSNFAAAQVCVDTGAPNFDVTVDLVWTDNSDNEEGFVLYYNGSPDAAIPADQTQFNFTIPVVDSVPVNIGISAYNAAGASAIQTLQIVCP
ncbi:MAG: hypothetical protein B5M51_08090 [Anaerolinea sp. 4484_236]|nr:MAG: hypothetical protein B5M51_08090 [Anaerolinea sp. 4484_236]